MAAVGIVAGHCLPIRLERVDLVPDCYASSRLADSGGSDRLWHGGRYYLHPPRLGDFPLAVSTGVLDSSWGSDPAGVFHWAHGGPRSPALGDRRRVRHLLHPALAGPIDVLVHVLHVFEGRL